jgi:transposase
MTIASELYSFGRFVMPDQLMSFLGLTPSEYSSSDTRRQGGITKSGNAQVRCVLVEAAWHYQHRPAIGVQLKKRREGQPEPVIVSRELVGFLWSAHYDLQMAPAG